MLVSPLHSALTIYKASTAIKNTKQMEILEFSLPHMYTMMF